MSDVKSEIFSQPLVVINLGLENFARNLEIQGVEVIRVDWKPPAGGDQEMIDILDQLL
jgi:hypothetical protein